MEAILYKGVEDFCFMLDDIVCNEPDIFVNVVGHFDVISEIFKELMTCDFYNPCSIEFVHPDIDGYEKEYGLSIDENGDVNIYPVYIDGEYVQFLDNDVVFVFEDVSSKFVTSNEDAIMFEVDYICDGDCENCIIYDNDYHIIW